MEITEVKVFPVSEEKLKAFVSVVIDDCFMVNDIKIIQGRENRFISMPSRRKKSGDFKDVAHPLNNETRRMMEDRILAEYDRVLAGREDEPVSERAATAAASGAAGRRAHRSTEDESGSEAEAGKTLEEVAEKHLSDSFWSS